MVDNKLKTRSNRHLRKRRLNRNLMIFIALAFLFLTILLSLIVLNKNAESGSNQDNSLEEQKISEKEEEEKAKEKEEKIKQEEDKKAKEEEAAKEKKEKNSGNSVKEIESEKIEDSNVLKAFVGDWAPSGTSQKGPHKTNYQNGSQDRIEIKSAVSEVTGVSEDDMVEWRVENNGEQKVISTISDSDETEFYRVYLTWVDNQGWQTQRLEHLKKNDKK